MTTNNVSLRVKLNADGKELIADVNDVQRAFKRLDRDVRRVGGGESLDRLAKGAKRAAAASSALAAAGGAAAAVLVTRLVRGGLESGDALAKQSAELGIATERLAAYQRAAEITGVAQDSVAKAMQRLSRTLLDAQQGSKTAESALSALGLSASELISLTPDQALERFADAIREVESPTLKAALAQQALGRSGAQLLNFLDLGSEGMNDFARQTEIAGTAMSAQLLGRIEQANDAMGQISLATQGLGQQLAAQFAPLITDVSNRIFQFAEEMGGMGNVAELVFTRIIDVVGSVADGINLVSIGFQGFRAGVVTAGQVITNVLQVIDHDFTVLVNGGKAALNTLIEGVTIAFESVLDQISSIALRASQIDVLPDGLQRQLESIAGGLRTAAAATRELGDSAKLSESQTSALLTGLGDAFGEAGQRYRQEFVDALQAPIPSEALEEWIAKVQEGADAQSEAWLKARDAQNAAATLNTDDVLKSLAEQTAASKAYGTALDSLLGKLDPVAKAQSDVAQDVTLIAQAFQKGDLTVTQYTKLLGELGKQYQTLLDPQAKAKEQQTELLAQMLPLKTATREYGEELLLLKAALDDSNATDEERAEALANLKREYIELFPEIQRNQAAADSWAEAWQRAIERIDSAFADAWKGAFDGFDDFRDELLNGFKQLAAELAHQRITKPLIDAFTGGIAQAGGRGIGGGGGGGGFNVYGAVANQVLGGGGAGGGIFAGGGGGYSINAGLLTGGLGSLGGAYSSLIGGAGNLSAAAFGFGSAADDFVVNAFGNQAANFSSTGARFGLKGNAGLGAGILANAALGYAGGTAGTAAGEALFGKQAESAYGQIAGSVIGSFFGPVGTLVGSAIGGLADAAFGGDGKRRSTIGVATSSTQNRPNAFAEQVGASGLRFQAIENRGGDNGRDAAQSLFDTLLMLDGALVELAGRSGIAIDFSDRSLGTSSGVAGKAGLEEDFFGVFGFNGADQGDLVGAADEFVKQFLAEIDSELPKRVRDGLKGVTQTAEEIVGAFEQLQAIDQLLDLDVVNDTAEVLQVLADAQRPLLDQYGELTQQVLDAGSGLDGTAESMGVLTQALDAQKRVALDLAVAYQTLGAEVGARFGSTINQIQESLLNEEELYGRRRQQIAELTAELATTLDPGRIAELTGQIDSLASGAFQGLDEGQQQSLASEFIGFLEQANDLSQRQIAAGLADLEARETGVRSAVDLELGAQSSRVQERAAEAQAAAAAQNQATADQFAQSVQRYGDIVEQAGQQQLANLQATYGFPAFAGTYRRGELVIP